MFWGLVSVLFLHLLLFGGASRSGKLSHSGKLPEKMVVQETPQKIIVRLSGKNKKKPKII